MCVCVCTQKVSRKKRRQHYVPKKFCESHTRKRIGANQKRKDKYDKGMQTRYWWTPNETKHAQINWEESSLVSAGYLKVNITLIHSLAHIPPIPNKKFPVSLHSSNVFFFHSWHYTLVARKGTSLSMIWKEWIFVFFFCPAHISFGFCTRA